jgi:hypothetical protein
MTDLCTLAWSVPDAGLRWSNTAYAGTRFSGDPALVQLLTYLTTALVFSLTPVRLFLILIEALLRDAPLMLTRIETISSFGK